MTNKSQDIRHLMNLMESVSKPVLLEGWLDGIKNKLDGRMGRKAREQMADRFSKEWFKWLGQTSRSGTMEDMVRFMTVRIGFTSDDIRSVLNQFHEQTGEEVDADIPGGVAPPSSAEVDDSDTEDSDEHSDATDDSDTEASDWDSEEGYDIPQDLDTKLNDYADVGQIEQAAKTKPENDDVVDNPTNYTTRGKLDQDKISKKLSSMVPGQRLVLGKKAYWVGTPNESIQEADHNEPVLDRRGIAAMMDISAARVNDYYLLDGPKNDEVARNATARALDYGRGGSSRGPTNRTSDDSLPPNTGGSSRSGQYDPKEMIDVLKSVNYSVTRVDSLSRKVGKSNSVSDMSDQDMDELALIGFAFLRSRS